MITKDYLSPSSARALDKGTPHLVEYWNTPRDAYNPAFSFGIAFEALLTERFDNSFVVYEKPEPDKNMNSKANKQALNALINSGLTVLMSDDMPILKRLVENCRPYAKTLRLKEAQHQVKCEITLHGVKWLGFADLFDGDVTEIKTGIDASNKGLTKAIYQHLYYLQLRIYQLSLGADKCKIIIGEKKAPCMTNYVVLSKEWEAMADAKILELCDKFKRWQDASAAFGGVFLDTMYNGSREPAMLSPENWMSNNF